MYLNCNWRWIFFMTNEEENLDVSFVLTRILHHGSSYKYKKNLHFGVA